MNSETLQDLFVEQIRDIYDAEKQLVKALPKMAKAANSEDLANALRNHLEETQNQVTRLEEVFRSVGLPPKGKSCKGMKGLIEEGNETVQAEEDERLTDLAIIAAAQRVEHYEISAYGTAKAIAEHLGNQQAVRLLEETEEEESAADAKLSEIAAMIYQEEEEPEEEAAETEERKPATMARGSARSASSGRGGGR